MRAFIAIEIPDIVKQGMAETQIRLKNTGISGSWTRPEGVHLTLKFLGEIEPELGPKLNESLRAAVAGTGRIRVGVAGIGAFPHAKNPRVIWLGLAGELQKIAALHAAVEDVAATFGFEREQRPFQPHITLCRVKSITRRDAWLRIFEEMKSIDFPFFDASSVSLMKSELHASGAVYTRIGSAELG